MEKLKIDFGGALVIQGDERINFIGKNDWVLSQGYFVDKKINLLRFIIIYFKWKQWKKNPFKYVAKGYIKSWW